MLWVINLKNNYRNILMITLFVFVLGISVNVYAETCTGVFDRDFLIAVRDYVYKPIKWGTPIILLLLTSLDFAKIVFSGKKEDMDKAKNNFLKRSVAALIIFFAPDIIILIANLASGDKISSCMNSLK